MDSTADIKEMMGDGLDNFKNSVKRFFKPNSNSVKSYILFKGHHPYLFRFLTGAALFLLISALVLSSFLTAMNYLSYLPAGEDTINISTDESAKIMSGKKVMKNSDISSYLISPVNWKIESNNPVGSVDIDGISSTYNMTQYHDTLKVSFHGNTNSDFGSINDTELFQSVVENSTDLDVNITKFGELYGAIKEDTVVSGEIKNSTVGERKFKLNIYFKRLGYEEVGEILSCFMECGSIERDRYLLRELPETGYERLDNQLENTRFRHYWNVRSSYSLDPSKMYIGDIIERKLIEKPRGFTEWVNSGDIRDSLAHASPTEYIELIEEYTAQRFSSGSNRVICQDYTEGYISAFYSAKKYSDSDSIENLHVFKVSSTLTTPGLFEGGHSYVAVIGLHARGIDISFVDPDWSDEDFLSLKHIFMPTKRNKFNAYDDYHHISFYRSEYLEGQMIRNRIYLLIGSAVFISITAFFTHHLVAVLRRIKKIEKGQTEEGP